MDQTLLAGIVGAGGVVAGALIQTLGPNLTHLFKRSGTDVPDLRGKWDATWEVTRGTRSTVYARDVIDITKQSGSEVIGHGIDYRQDYPLRGVINTQTMITFSYDYGPLNFPLVGSGVLVPNSTFLELNGLWIGHIHDRSLVTGKVVWRSHRDPSRPSHDSFHQVRENSNATSSR